MKFHDKCLNWDKLKIKKHPKSIRKIYMVSLAAFSAASCVYGRTVPLGAALSLTARLLIS